MTRSLKSQIAWSIALVIGVALAAALLLWKSANSAGLQGKDLYAVGVDLYRTLLIGTAVALAGTLLPLVFKESRESFEQRKAARHAYSDAKTGLDYVHVRLASLELTEAVALLQSIHVNKHVAESYPELAEFVHGKSVSQWSTNAYDLLASCRMTLEDSVDIWNELRPSARIEKLRQLSPRREKESNLKTREQVGANA